MGINLCRHNPKRFVPYVRNVYKNHVLLAGGLGKKQTELIARLNSQDGLNSVKFDAQANEACHANNQAVIDKEEETPTKGGNIAKYSELSGGDKSSSCHEFTMVKYTGSTGEDFVALQLAVDFEGMNEGVKQPEAPVTETAPAAEINADAGANAMDGGAPTDGTAAADAGAAPDKSTGEEAKKETAAAAKKPAAAAPAAPGYSPILDSEVTMIGVSNKSHKKTINLIQVLYCSPAGNAMV